MPQIILVGNNGIHITIGKPSHVSIATIINFVTSSSYYVILMGTEKNKHNFKGIFASNE